MALSRSFLAPLLLAVLLIWGAASQAADRERLREFLEVTGFDVAIASIQLDAMSGPALAGEVPQAFGADWTRMAEVIFDPDSMIDRAIDMMQTVMPDHLVDHGIDFYGSDLGQRLVAVENASQMEESELTAEGGAALLEMLAESDPARLARLRAFSRATGSADNAIRALIEVQLRYLVAASRAGIIKLRVDETELRLMLQAQTGEMRAQMEQAGLLSAAWTYRDLSTADLERYTEALENEKMRQIYEILNAVQFELMAERYERLAAALADLHPQQDI